MQNLSQIIFYVGLCPTFFFSPIHDKNGQFIIDFYHFSGRTPASEESLMFKDFDYISPEMSDRFNNSTEKKSEDPSTTLLPDEMQELRIRGFGP